MRAAHWLTNINLDWQTPMWRPWFDALSTRYRFYRYDSRGCGLSDSESIEASLDVLVADLEAVVDAAKLDRFALLGTSQGGAISIAYAVRHPERVTHLVLLGAFARGPLRCNPSSEDLESFYAQLKLPGAPLVFALVLDAEVIETPSRATSSAPTPPRSRERAARSRTSPFSPRSRRAGPAAGRRARRWGRAARGCRTERRRRDR